MRVGLREALELDAYGAAATTDLDAPAVVVELTGLPVGQHCMDLLPQRGVLTAVHEVEQNLVALPVLEHVEDSIALEGVLEPVKVGPVGPVGVDALEEHTAGILLEGEGREPLQDHLGDARGLGLAEELVAKLDDIVSEAVLDDLVGGEGDGVDEVLLDFEEGGVILVLLDAPQHVLEHAHRILVGGELEEVLVGDVVEVEGHFDGETLDDLLDKVGRNRMQAQVLEVLFDCGAYQFVLLSILCVYVLCVFILLCIPLFVLLWITLFTTTLLEVVEESLDSMGALLVLNEPRDVGVQLSEDEDPLVG